MENKKTINTVDVGNHFSFAKYLNENFSYLDNTDVGDVYKKNNEVGIYSEKDIYNEWLNLPSVIFAKRKVCKCDWNKQFKVFSSGAMTCKKCGGVIGN